MTKLLQKETIKFDCPHCKQAISDAWLFQMDSVIGKRYAYLCGNCEKLIKISKTPFSFTSRIKDKGNFTPN